jgi:hypothetical protein
MIPIDQQFFFREIDTTTNQMFFVIVKHQFWKSNHHFLDG